MKHAFPSQLPGGLDANLADHFGHCAAYTMVDIEDGQVGDVTVVPNKAHDLGIPLAPVVFLRDAGVKALLTTRMGMRPLVAFHQVGIEVYYNEDQVKVRDAVELFRQSNAPKYDAAMAMGSSDAGGCSTGGAGGGGCGGHHEGGCDH
jgi:predicted Fe-Mo cluster-binding NifX family protein